MPKTRPGHLFSRLQTPAMATVLIGVGAFALTPAGALAQTPAFAGRDVIVAEDAGSLSKPVLLRPDGTLVPIPVSVPLQGLAGLTATRQGELVLADGQSGAVVLVPPTGPASVLATVPGAYRVSEDIDGAFLVASTTTTSVERVTRSGQTSTVFALTGGVRALDVVIDGNGDYVFCNDRLTVSSWRGIYRVDRQTKVVTRISNSRGVTPVSIAWFHNGDLAIVDGVQHEIYRLNLTTNLLSLFVDDTTLGNVPQSIVASGDGGFFVTLDDPTIGREVIHVDSQGQVSPHGGPTNLGDLEQLTVIPSLSGPTDLTTGPSAVHEFGLDLDDQPGAPYWIVLSGSIRPGVPLPGDGRGFSVNVDGVLLWSLSGSASTMLVRFAGLTDASGQARPTLDLTGIPAMSFAGIHAYMQGFTFDPSAPNGVGAITNPLRIDFR